MRGTEAMGLVGWLVGCSSRLFFFSLSGRREGAESTDGTGGEEVAVSCCLITAV